MRRRLLSLSLAGSLLPGVGVARAQPRPSSAGSPVRELVLWTMQLSPFHDAYIRGLLADFEAQHPGARVRWVDVPWAEMERKALASMAAGTAPDVINLNPQFAARLAELGVLHDPRGHLAPEQVDSYVPAAWQANQLAGRPFAVPWYLSTTVTLVHRGLLQRAGVAVPHRAHELLAAARAVRSQTGQYAWFPAMDGAAPLETLVSLHGRLFAEDGCSLSVPAPGSPDMFGFFRTLYAERLLPPAVLTEGHRGSVARFAAGEVAMISTGMQFLEHIRKNDPALYRQVGVAPQLSGAPAGTPGAAPNIAAMNLAVPTASREPGLAFALAAFITNAENQLALVRRVPLLPSSRASYSDALFSTPSGDALMDEARAISARQVFAGRVQVPPLRQYHKLRASFVRALQSAMAGRLTPAQARAQVDEAWRVLRGCVA